MLGLGPQEIVLLCILGMLLFGRKLPEVGRSLGRSIVAFKQGLTGAEDDAEPSVPELTRPQDGPSNRHGLQRLRGS